MKSITSEIKILFVRINSRLGTGKKNAMQYKFSKRKHQKGEDKRRRKRKKRRILSDMWNNFKGPNTTYM